MTNFGEVFFDVAGDTEVVLRDASSSLQNNLELLFVIECGFG